MPRATESALAAFVIAVVATSSFAGCRSEKRKRAIAPELSATAPPPQSPPPPTEAPKPADVTFPSRGRMLRGTITRPAGAGPFPAFLYNHGSERHPGHYRSLRSFFASHGYVFFVAYRTGHEPSPGPYIVDQIQKAPDRRGAAPGRLLSEQAEDVESAMKFLSNEPYVIKSRIAVGGCSFGGIETIFAAERGWGFKAAIDWAGDAESWKNTVLRQRLLKAVDRAKVPTFFLQAENDYSTEPTRVFGQEAERMHKPHKSKIFPVYGDPSSHEEGHAGFCVKGHASWGKDVLQFLDQYNK